MSESTLPLKRCPWPGTDPLMIQYHDREWGVPVHDDRRLFEFLVLEAAQAGLNWSIILKKREGFRKAFDNFDPANVARYTDRDVRRLLSDRGVIRNRLKIMATTENARRFRQIQEEFGSFDRYVWQFVGGRPIQHAWKSLSDYPTTIRESDVLSVDLQKRAFKFVGSTICYAFMQAVGLVNDHVVHCFRYNEVSNVEG